MAKVTISDIAKEAGVSKAAVSMILSDAPLGRRMAETTRKKVRRIAEKLEYKPSLVASSLSSGKTRALGMVIGDIDTPFYAEVAAMALRTAESRGQQLLISVTSWCPEKELACLDSLIQRQVDGVIFCTNALNPDTAVYKKILKQHFPLVLFEAEAEGISSVHTDFYPGALDAVRLLHHNGHRRIGFVDIYKSSFHNKQSAFKQACEVFGIEPVFLFEQISENWAERVERRIMDCGKDLKALIVAADHQASWIISHLGRKGIRVPDDLDMVGIDGTRLGMYNNPPLTSIRQPVELQMEKAVELLLNPPEFPQRIMLPSRLIVRESVKKCGID